MTPYHSDPWLTVWQGDCREVMAQMEPESVHGVVTSPPYWGLRDYGTASWLGGDEGHIHEGAVMRTAPPGTEKQASNRGASAVRSGPCQCGAIRQDSQLGLEPTPEEYVANMVAVFREVRRVLRKDGTCWVNLGDSYGTGASGGSVFDNGRTDGRKSYETDQPRGRLAQPKIPGLKPKDLVGIPWRVAFALQADGWYLRSDIIWAKPNPMPESVTDRPTKAHEYLFLLTKSARYYFDGEAVRRPISPYNEGKISVTPHDGNAGRVLTEGHRKQEWREYDEIKGANIRTVWNIATQPYPGAHFATFPEALVEPCVKAGTSERGVCPKCGAPWRRVVERGELELVGTNKRHETGKHETGHAAAAKYYGEGAMIPGAVRPSITTGWQPSCAHELPTIPATVLDPFAGSGTTGRVAQRLGRRAVLIDLNGEYLTQAMTRNADIPLGLEAS